LGIQQNSKNMYEIDYLPVGTGSKGGDAIALRYGDFSSPATQKVVIVDGGTKDSGKALVEHVKTYYGTSHVDTVVATHLHNDHVSGLTEVLENLTVGKLVIHLPWDYSAALKRMTVTQASTSSIGNKLEKSLVTLSSIIDIAEAKRIPIVQAFAGEQILDGLYVLGPSKDYYQSLLANFGITPEAKEGHKIEGFIGAVKDALSFIAETMHIETLPDDYPDTSPENNSSLILLLLLDGKRFLFTGDAGKDALTRAINFAESKNVSLANIDFFDVPHHGSKRNLGPAILNHLMPKASIISCPPDGDPKHPSRKVCNALLRRNSTLHTTRNGKTLCNPCEDAPDRGWTSATPESFYHEVEE
jgi:beta-lactamase superfamily II metal-dependent hydrolase